MNLLQKQYATANRSLNYTAVCYGTSESRDIHNDGGKHPMCRLINVIQSDRVDLKAMVTHCFTPNDIEPTADLIGNQTDSLLKVVLMPSCLTGQPTRLKIIQIEDGALDEDRSVD